MIPRAFQQVFQQFSRPETLPEREWRTLLQYYYDDVWRSRRALQPEEIEGIKEDLSKLTIGIPLAYVTGKAHFYGRIFSVRSEVLIPRPETEELAEWAIQSLPPKARVVDIGCGSGCLGITLAKERPDIFVSAMDLSSEALEVTAENVRALEAELSLFQGDVLLPNKFMSGQAWDAIVSNPPYVRPSEFHASTRHEPALALYTPEDDPLLFYRALRRYGQDSLCSSGQLFLEVSEYFGEETRELFNGPSWDIVTLKKDLQGKNRMLYAQKV